MATKKLPKIICNVIAQIKVTVKDDWDESWSLAELRKKAEEKAIRVLGNVIKGGSAQYGRIQRFSYVLR